MKRSFWKLFLENLKEVWHEMLILETSSVKFGDASHETLVWEASSVKFGGRLA